MSTRLTGRFLLASLLIIGVTAQILSPVAQAVQQDFETRVLASPGLTVTPDFPQGLTFTLDAGEPLIIARANLLFSVGKTRTMYQSTARIPASPEEPMEIYVDLLTLGIPPGVTLTYHWQLLLQDGTRVTTIPAPTDWFDDRFDWQIYRADGVEVYAYAGEEAFLQQAADMASATLAEYGQRFDSPPRREPLRIWLYESQAHISGALSPNSRDWIGGVSYARFSLVAAVAEPGNDWSVKRVVPHETVHQVINDATLNPFSFPATWLDEGLATAAQPVDLQGMDELVLEAFANGTLPTVQSMISEFGSDGGTIRLSYASSYSVVMFIEETMGRAALNRIVATYRLGLTHDQTLQEAIGMTTAELDQAWRNYLDGQK